MNEKQNKHYPFNVFPERNVRNVIFRFCLHDRKKVEEICFSFYQGCIANFRNRILNIDQLEIKHT